MRNAATQSVYCGVLPGIGAAFPWAFLRGNLLRCRNRQSQSLAEPSRRWHRLFGNRYSILTLTGVASLFAHSSTAWMAISERR